MCLALARAALSAARQPFWGQPSAVEPGRATPLFLTDSVPDPAPGVAHAPLVVVVLSAEIARAKSVARHFELPIGTPF